MNFYFILILTTTTGTSIAEPEKNLQLRQIIY